MSTGDQLITVQVVYASARLQLLREVQLAAGSTVDEAIQLSGIESLLPMGLPDPGCLGIHSRKVSRMDVVRNGDRIEIYRPLTFDPMEARRRRARGRR